MLDPDQRPADRQSLTDEELMLRVQSGEKACFDLLVQRYKTRLFNYLLRLVRDPDLAERTMRMHIWGLAQYIEENMDFPA